MDSHQTPGLYPVFLGDHYIDESMTASWAALLRRCFSSVFDSKLPWSAADRLAFLRSAWLGTRSEDELRWKAFLPVWLRAREKEYYTFTEQARLVVRDGPFLLVAQLLQAVRSVAPEDRHLVLPLLPWVESSRRYLLASLARDSPLSRGELIELLMTLEGSAAGAADVRRQLETDPPPSLSSAERAALIARALRVTRAYAREVDGVRNALAR